MAENVTSPFIKIYIPLWLYSNWIEGNGYEFYEEFTFHYGYILIHNWRFERIPPFWFTFHYGYILIMSVNKKIRESYLFTFHYGYILINITTSIFPMFFNIYIPLWLYSNQLTPTTPLLFDFVFTFHYGYILIDITIATKHGIRYLHSTMVIF